MKKPKAKAIIRKAFAALTPLQKENLRHHATNGTKIACGEDAEKYVNAEGYG